MVEAIYTPDKNEQNYSFRVSFLDQPNFTHSLHQHDEVEILYIIESTGSRTVGDLIERFGPGDMVILGPDLPHQWKNDPIYYDDERRGAKRVKAMVVQFKKDFWGKEFLELPEMKCVKQLLDSTDRGIKFKASTHVRLQNLLYSLKTTEGSNRVILLLDILRSMANSQGYEFLASEEYDV